MKTESSKQLRAIGQQIRDRRKSLGVSAVVTAETAGISRVTLHRVEKGEPSVTMGGYFNVAKALGLTIGISAGTEFSCGEDSDHQQVIPVRIKLADYPQLKLLAWHISGADELTPVEALALYERNQRHIDEEKIDEHERRLIESLRSALQNRS